MGLMDGAVNGMVLRLCAVAFSPDEAFCIAQAAYIAPDKRDPRVPPSILKRQEVTWEVDQTLKRLGPYPMGPETHRQRILLWEKIFGYGTWHEPIDPATIYLPGDPKPPRPPVSPQSDQPTRGAVSPPAGPVPSQPGSHGLNHEMAAPTSGGSSGGKVALIVIALVVIVVFWVAGATQKPQAAASGSAANDGQAAAIRAALQGAPDWHHYTDDVYFRWDSNPQCVGMLSCSGVDVETASTHSCSFGSVWLDLMRNGVVVDSRIGTFQSLSAGIPKLVQVYWNPGVTGDHVQINHIACGTV